MINYKFCCVRLELPVKCQRFWQGLQGERYLSHFIDKWHISFISTFLYQLQEAQNLPLYKQPQIGISSKRLLSRKMHITGVYVQCSK